MLYLDRYSLIELWRKWYEYAGAVQVPPVNILIVPFSYLFLAPDRSCSVNPETNISNIVRKEGPRIMRKARHRLHRQRSRRLLARPLSQRWLQLR